MQKTKYFTLIPMQGSRSGSEEALSLLERSAAQNGIFMPVWMKEKSFEKVLVKTAPIPGRKVWMALPGVNELQVPIGICLQ